MSQISILNNAIFPPGTAVVSLTGNIGGVVGPSIADNINILGGGGVLVTGNPVTNTLTITLAGGAGTVDQVATDIGGPVIPVGNSINILGAINQIETTGVGDTVTIGIVTNPIIAGTVEALAFLTDTAAAQVGIIGNTISAGGTNPTVNLNIFTQGGGTIDFRGIDVGYAGSSWNFKQVGIQTVDATVTPIITLPVINSQMLQIKAFINGFRNTFVDCIVSEVWVAAYREPAGDIIIVNAPIINLSSTSTTMVTATIDVGTETLRVNVIGVAAQTFNWVASYSYFYTVSNA